MNCRCRVFTAVGLAGAALMLAGCAAGDARFAAETPAGFWMGLWHGAISLITLVIHIFNSSVKMYETANSGGWYDLGFLLGAVCVWGSCCGSGVTCKLAGRKKHGKRSEEEWDEIGNKVEKKIMRKLRSWAEADPEDDWDDVEAKLEEKLKRKIRQWAEDDDA